jgi:hypothetical protein
MRRLIVATVLTTVACSAQMVRPAGESSSKYAPVNERSQPGLVKYLNDGASFVVKRRRENAYKQMYESCQGPYRIVAEGQHAEGGVVITSGSATAQANGSSTEQTFGGTTRGTTRATVEATSDATTVSSEIHYWYIQYACVTTAPDSSSK